MVRRKFARGASCIGEVGRHGGCGVAQCVGPAGLLGEIRGGNGRQGGIRAGVTSVSSRNRYGGRCDDEVTEEGSPAGRADVRVQVRAPADDVTAPADDCAMRGVAGWARVLHSAEWPVLVSRRISANSSERPRL